MKTKIANSKRIPYKEAIEIQKARLASRANAGKGKINYDCGCRFFQTTLLGEYRSM
jgi:hypothetical protein